MLFKLVFLGWYFPGITTSLQVCSCPIKAMVRSFTAARCMDLWLLCLSCSFDFPCVLRACLSQLSLCFKRLSSLQQPLSASNVAFPSSCQYIVRQHLMVLYFVSLSLVSMKYTNLHMLSLRNIFFFQFVQINVFGSAANPFAYKIGALYCSTFYYLILSLLVGGMFCQWYAAVCLFSKAQAQCIKLVECQFQIWGQNSHAQYSNNVWYTLQKKSWRAWLHRINAGFI